MATFTIMLEFKGGTYIAQVRARGPHKACLKWAKTIEIADLGAAGKAELQKQLQEDEPVLLAGLVNVWCMTASVRKSFALMNIIQTQIE